MLARLLLALLLLAFVTPVATASPCHGAVATMTMMHGGTDHPAATHDAAPMHICVGCVPPGDWIATRLPLPMATPTLHPAAGVAQLALRPAIAPGLRPPRGA